MNRAEGAGEGGAGEEGDPGGDRGREEYGESGLDSGSARRSQMFLDPIDQVPIEPHALQDIWEKTAVLKV